MYVAELRAWPNPRNSPSPLVEIVARSKWADGMTCPHTIGEDEIRAQVHPDDVAAALAKSHEHQKKYRAEPEAASVAPFDYAIAGGVGGCIVDWRNAGHLDPSRISFIRLMHC